MESTLVQEQIRPIYPNEDILRPFALESDMSNIMYILATSACVKTIIFS